MTAPPHTIGCGDVAPNEPLIEMRRLREKPAQTKHSKLLKSGFHL